MSDKPVYILGTALSHDGSTCLLKDGEIVCAIEKERLTRKKHDGGNDLLTVQYCLDYAGISVDDLSLVVQAANFEKDSIQKDQYQGRRYFNAHCKVPFVSISHHLAHAYSAIGTCPYNEFNVLVIDGCGSPLPQCDDLEGAVIFKEDSMGVNAEKDSFYHFSSAGLQSIFKDFSLLNPIQGTVGNRLPTTNHSIGGLYSMVSRYVFGNMDDVGKLMGLAPYGDKNVFTDKIFMLTDGRVFVKNQIFHLLDKPATSYQDFKDRFNYFADIAAWVQKEVEEAILYTVTQRLQHKPHSNLCYTGGVALNAVANARILRETGIKNLYMAPAAADNGLSLGCAYYGWLQVLKKPRVIHNGSTYFGKLYSDKEIEADTKRFIKDNPEINMRYTIENDVSNTASILLAEGKVIGWFQGQSEFGPRALGNRSILADGRKEGVQKMINRDIKFREDFRPFAPAVMAQDAGEYFEYGYDSPYMILVDKVKDKYKEVYKEVVHVNGSARVQTVTPQLNPLFYSLIDRFRQKTGSGVLLNTSLNKKGTPIAETPYEALTLFYETQMDALVVHNYVFAK